MPYLDLINIQSFIADQQHEMYLTGTSGHAVWGHEELRIEERIKKHNVWMDAMTEYWDERDLPGQPGLEEQGRTERMEETHFRGRKSCPGSVLLCSGASCPARRAPVRRRGRSPPRWQVPVRLSRWKSLARPAGPGEDHRVPSSSRYRVGR